MVAEKAEEELRQEIDELYRQQREITVRLRDPRGVRRGGFGGAGPRNFPANGGRGRGFIRPAERNDAEDQPPAKRRLSSAVVKVEDGEIADGGSETVADVHDKDADEAREGTAGEVRGSFGLQRPSKMDFDALPAEPVPRVFPKNEDPKLRFRKEDMQLASTEAYMKRSDSLKRAERRAREESEKLRQQEREQIAEKRKRDLILRARTAAKAEEKKLDLLFLRWSEHHRKLGNFVRTQAKPPIFYMFAKPLDEKPTLSNQEKGKIFEEWKAARREELTHYQSQISEQYIGNVDKELEKWQNGRKGRRPNSNAVANLQETMDKELETHQLEHGPKTRKIPDQSNEDEDDVEDINATLDDMMDDVLGMDESIRKEAIKVEENSAANQLEENKEPQ